MYAKRKNNTNVMKKLLEDSVGKTHAMQMKSVLHF